MNTDSDPEPDLASVTHPIPPDPVFCGWSIRLQGMRFHRDKNANNSRWELTNAFDLVFGD